MRVSICLAIYRHTHTHTWHTKHIHAYTLACIQINGKFENKFIKKLMFFLGMAFIELLFFITFGIF